MASSEPSRKRGREEVPLPPPTEPEEVPPPPPEEVKQLKPPQRKVARHPVVPFLRASKGFSVKMLYEAWQNLGKLVIHLGVQIPPGPLQMTVMDYAFKVNALAGKLERQVVPTSTTTTTTMAASTSPALALTLTPTPTVGLLWRRLPLLN
jgi:hypothetical protein